MYFGKNKKKDYDSFNNQAGNVPHRPPLLFDITNE